VRVPPASSVASSTFRTVALGGANQTEPAATEAASVAAPRATISQPDQISARIYPITSFDGSLASTLTLKLAPGWKRASAACAISWRCLTA
jgi:hypothetical protein